MNHANGEIVIVTKREDLAVIIGELFIALLQKHACFMPPEVVELEKLKRKEYLTTEEVAKLYPLNPNTLRKRRLNGQGPAYSKDGENVIYSQRAIQNYLESQRRKTSDQA